MEVPCVVCGEIVARKAYHASTRETTCSTVCRAIHTFGSARCDLPPDHPVSRLMRRAAAQARLAKAAAGTQGDIPWYSGPCRECGTEFIARSRSKSCSDECRTRTKIDNAKARRRAPEAFVEPVYRVQLYERDDWCCQICGEPVLREATVPHPLAPTIDHVIPFHCGGTHEPSNCQTAHFLCNSLKGDAAA